MVSCYSCIATSFTLSSMYLISSKSNENNLEDVRESWELDCSTLRQGNGEIANDGEIDDEFSIKFIINIPIGTNTSKNANHKVIRGGNISKNANHKVIRDNDWELDNSLVIGRD